MLKGALVNVLAKHILLMQIAFSNVKITDAELLEPKHR